MDEPNYRLTDADGNVVGDIGVDANGNPTVEHADSGESVSITEDGLVTQSLSTETVVDDYHFAGAFDGADADARLDNALSAASDGQTIYLETAPYGVDRNIPKDVEIVGSGTAFRPQSQVSGDWTLTGYASIRNIDFEESTITDDSGFANITRVSGATIQINSDGAIVESCWGVDVTFASGTSRGGADSLYNSTVTDNGSNSIGDV